MQMRTEIEDEGEDLHLGSAERAQQRVDLVDAGDQLRPAELSMFGRHLNGGLEVEFVDIRNPV